MEFRQDSNKVHNASNHVDEDDLAAWSIEENWNWDRKIDGLQLLYKFRELSLRLTDLRSGQS